MDLPSDSDFDFFFATPDQFGAFVTQIEAKGAKKNYENDFNVTYSLPGQEKEPALKVQLIRVSYHPTLEETIGGFDFSLCQCGFDGTDFVFGAYTLFDLANKRLFQERLATGLARCGA